MNIAKFLKERNVDFELIPHRETHDAQRMAATLHVSGNQVAKTVLLRANGGYTYVVAVLPATTNVDLSRVAEMLGGSRLQLATESEIAQHCPDCEIGALPPFGSQYGMKTIIDAGFREDDAIVFEGNTHHEAIRMSFADFCRIEQPLTGEFAEEVGVPDQ